MNKGKEIVRRDRRIEQNVERRWSDAGAASTIAYPRENPEIRVTTETEDVAGIEIGIGVLP